MTTYTVNYRFTLPDYNAYGWGDANNKNFVAIDALLAQFTTSLSLQGVWTNNTIYAAGVSVIDSVTGHLWYSAVAHTSALTPTDFATDRTNNPSYWTDITNPAIPAAAAAATAATSATNATNSAIAAAASAQFVTQMTLFRNRLYNPSMEITQRNAPFNISAGSAVYTLDRWRVSCSGSAITVNKGALTNYAARSQLNITASISSGSYVTIEQRIESGDIADLVGKQVTVSFSAGYGYNTPLTVRVIIASPSVADNYTSTSTIQFIDVPLTATTPTQYTVTFNALPVGAANGLSLQFGLNNLSVTAGLLFNITNVVLEPGNTATSFERIPLAFEQARCQRFYQTFTVNCPTYSSTGGTILQGAPLPVVMRVPPAVSLTGIIQNNCSGINSSAGISAFQVQALCTSTGTCQFVATVTLSAEL